LFFIALYFDNELFAKDSFPSNYQLSTANCQLSTKKVLSLPHRRLAVLNGVDRTMMVACHAHRAIAIPFWATLFKGDVL
jgi:hypothetical protein